MSSYGPFYLMGAALSVLSAYAQVPPGPGKFLEHEVSITTTALSGCQLVGTPPRITGLRISEASATFKIPQVFAANCPLLANAQLEIDLIPQFPSLPPAALRVASLPSGGGTNIDLRTPMPTAMAAKIKARADRFNRVAMVSAHGFDGFTRSRDCYVEKLDSFPVPRRRRGFRRDRQPMQSDGSSQRRFDHH